MEIEKKTSSILSKYDMQGLQVITMHEFISLIKKDPEILMLLKNFNFLLSDDLRVGVENDKDIVECDSDIDEEITGVPQYQYSENKVYSKTEENLMIQSRINNTSKQTIEFEQTEDLRPSFYKGFKADTTSPEVHIEVAHVSGFKAHDKRNTIKMTSSADLISISGTTAWLLSRKNPTAHQRIFQCHTQEISCIAVSAESLVATGEGGPNPTIHVWDYKTLQIKFSLNGVLRGGISHLAFSNDGKKLAAIESDSNHTVVVYNIQNLLTGKAVDIKDQISGIYQGPQTVVFYNPVRVRHDL